MTGLQSHAQLEAFAPVYLNSGVHWCECTSLTRACTRAAQRSWHKLSSAPTAARQELITSQSTSRRKESFILYFQRGLSCLASHIWHSACPTRKEQLPAFFLAVKLEATWTWQWSAGCWLAGTVRGRSHYYWATLYPKKGQSYSWGAEREQVFHRGIKAISFPEH